MTKRLKNIQKRQLPEHTDIDCKCKENIIKMVEKINNKDYLIKIYSFVSVFCEE